MTLHLSPASLIARNKQKQKEWREAHPERVKAYHVKHNAREETKARKLQWSRENSVRINARRRELYASRAERRQERVKEEPPH